jgi:hypothetical protein
MKSLARWDLFLFATLILFLLFVTASSGMANIQTDAIDYYAIVQRLVGDAPPIVPNLPFVEQRSPGYPLLTLPLYAALGLAPAGETESSLPPSVPSAGQGNPLPSERALLPPRPLRVSEIFFRNFDLAPQGGIFRWRIIAAMLLTGYGLFFSGVFITARALANLYPGLPGYSLVPLTVVTSMVLMHNLIQTPAYATLTAFGVSCWTAYFWVSAWKPGLAWKQTIAGLLAGALVLVRLEISLFVSVLILGLLAAREWRFLRNFILGGILPLTVLLAYNTAQFSNPFHAGIFRGNMNILTFDAAYAFAALVGPKSGILWYSMLFSLGVIGLLANRTQQFRMAGWGALALIGLILVRVPVMYFCVGEGSQNISGILVTCPADADFMLELIKFDSNRYIIPLIPFAMLGLRGWLDDVLLFFRRIQNV